MPLTRREFLNCALIPTVVPKAFAAAKAPRIYALQSYIFVQRLRPLAEKLDEMFSTIRESGFKNVELMSNFVAPPMRDRTESIMASQGLKALVVYTGGTLHDKEVAEKSMQQALDTADAAKAMGAVALNCNPNPKPAPGRKTDEELTLQARNLNRLGEQIQKRGLKLLVHHHAPEMAENAREWRHILANTDPAVVSLCVDVEWAFHGGQNPLTLLTEAGTRTREVHLRNSKQRVWAEAFENGDIDYGPIVAYLDKMGINPYLVVELAYDPKTDITRPLVEDIRLSRAYAEKLFGS